MARTPVLAAGGIVLRREKNPRIAVVRLRKRNEWVLPKGKLDDGETPRAAAEREVLEETGHDVSVHEFLGTLVYESGGRSKVVHYWRMEAGGEPVHELMHDIRAVDWLPLDAALERLSRGYERAFLENVGPIALQAAATAETARRTRAKPAAPAKSRARRVTPAPVVAPVAVPVPAPARVIAPRAKVAAPSIAEEMPAVPEIVAVAAVVVPEVAQELPPAAIEAVPEVVEAALEQCAPVEDDTVQSEMLEAEAVEAEVMEAEALEAEATETDAPVYSDDFRMVPQSDSEMAAIANESAELVSADAADSDAATADQSARASLVRKVRNWLRRAA